MFVNIIQNTKRDIFNIFIYHLPKIDLQIKEKIPD